ncbi:hypothetical protein GLO16_25875, partial [Shigella flexneri]|nr:hypothetical protein [Shigella flexneri 2a]MUW08888.1 hypothetical protein [Shigella flexneri]MUV72099.1 hypothetical protein [Shigella flexneri 2a]MUW13194.1 hypothetical protein [Shigella flexneri 2a]MUW40693.1 hypothetical protein [Shigella flexneri 2a]
MRFSTIVSVVTLVWGISPRQPSGKNIIRWLLKKRTNGSVRYCQYTSTHSLYAWVKKYGPDSSTNKEQSDAQA